MPPAMRAAAATSAAPTGPPGRGEEEPARRQADQRRPEGEGVHLGGGVAREEPEPGEVAREGDDEGLVRERPEDERGGAGEPRPAGGPGQHEQRDRRAGELV